MSFFGEQREPSERLARLSSRWRTDRQLRRLSRLPTAGGDRLSFAVLGDVEPSRFWIYRKLFNEEGVFARQMAGIQAHKVNFIVQLGDMVSKGEAGRYEGFFRDLRRCWRGGRPYLTVIGNHDRSRPNGKSHSSMYRSLFGRSNYFFDHARTRFVVLDSSAKRVTPAQLRWLDMVLATPLRKIVFTHMPPVHLGLWGGVGRVHALGGFAGGAREFSDVVARNGVSRVYMGHVHAFGVQDHLGVRYVLTGGGGSALFPSGSADRFHHFLTVDLSPAGIRERVHALDGRAFHIPSAPVIMPVHEHHRSWAAAARAYGRRLARVLGVLAAPVLLVGLLSGAPAGAVDVAKPVDASASPGASAGSALGAPLSAAPVPTLTSGLGTPLASPLAAPGAVPSVVPSASFESAVVPESPAGPERVRGSASSVREELDGGEGRLDETKLARAYDAGSLLLRGLPETLASDAYLGQHIRDGAPRQALARLDHLAAKHPALRGFRGRAAVELLRSRLETVRPSDAAAAFEKGLSEARGYLERRQFGRALDAARRAGEAVKAAAFGSVTGMVLMRELDELVNAVKNRGGPAVYGRKGEMTSAELAAKVRALQRAAPSAYVGGPLPGEAVRLQCYGDCAVQQAYNHPRLAPLADMLPYESFLPAVEAANQTRVRSKGLAYHESLFLLRRLGLDAVRHPAPKDAESLASLLRDRGPLMLGIDWRASAHAVILQGAYRENGRWSFVLIDSNRPRPQVYSYLDLQLLSPSEFASVEPLARNSPYLPPEIRAIADAGERVRAAARSFVERFAVLRPRVPGWKRAVFAALNAARARLGLEPLEPEPVLELDTNAIPLDRIASFAREAIRSGVKLPPEAFLTGPDGRRYLNRLVLEKFLARR